MNTSNPTPPALPDAVAMQHREHAGGPPLGELPGDDIPIPNFVSAIESILRAPRRILFHLRQGGRSALIPALLLAFVICGGAYGVVAGAFSGGAQLWAAPLKITGGLLLAGLICLPSLYIFACLSGCDARLAEMAGLLAALLTLTALLLAGFAPVVWVFSQSTESVSMMGALHLLFGAVATGFGLRFLRWSFNHFKLDSRAAIGVWLLMFVIVVLQMTTALRPIIGRADSFFPAEKKFFLTHWVETLRQN